MFPCEFPDGVPQAAGVTTVEIGEVFAPDVALASGQFDIAAANQPHRPDDIRRWRAGLWVGLN